MKLRKPVNGTIATTNVASVQAVAANDDRKWLEICNPTAVGMFLGLGAAAVVGYGPYIPAGGSMAFCRANGNHYVGAIHAILVSGGAAASSYSELS